jgi:hypothetical protein
MSNDEPPKDSLIVKLGDYFQASANGSRAIIALVIIALAVIAARAFGVS